VDIRKDSEALLMEIIKVLDLGQVCSLGFSIGRNGLCLDIFGCVLIPSAIDICTVVMHENCRIVDVGIVISVLTNQGEHFLHNDYIKTSVAKQDLSPYQVMKAAKGIQGSALQALQSVFDHQRSLGKCKETHLFSS
jgi:hypothetical protein